MMSSLRFLALGFLFLMLCSFGNMQEKKNTFDPKRVFTVTELQEDFRALRREMEKKQPNLYLYTSKQTIDQIFDSMYVGITQPMTFFEFYKYITPLVSIIKDGHNSIVPGDAAGKYAQKNLAYIPLHLMYVDGKLYSDMNCSRDSSIADGTEILSVNGKSADAIQQEMQLRMIRDGYNETLPQFLINTYFRGFFAVLSAYPETYTIEYRTAAGNKQTTTINALAYDSITKIRKEKYAARMAAQQTRQGLQLHFDSISATAILSIESFDPAYLRKKQHQHFKREIRRFMQRIDSAQSQTLIIDIRDNGGGNPTFSRFLLQCIMDRPFVYAEKTMIVRRFNPGNRMNRLARCPMPGFGKGTFRPHRKAFKGKIIVLTNGGSFSASGEFASVLERYKRAVFVGEETGGNKTICGGLLFNTQLKLPNTGITCYIGTESTCSRPLSENDGHGVRPTYEVKNNLADVLTNRDAVLEFALGLARGK